jgi:oligopeptide transport system permease protein
VIFASLTSVFLKRIFEAALTLLALVFMTFLLLRFLPGGPFDEETPLHPLVREKLAQSWELNGSFFTQFLSYLSGIFRGDLGWSLSDPNRSVASMISEGLGQTLSLNLLALVLIFVLGFSAALLGSLNPGGKLDQFLSGLTIALISLPSLFLGPLLIWIFALKLDWLPVAFLESPWHYILPVLTLSMRPSAYLARLLSSSLKEARSTDYMRTARAKGLNARQMLVNHALRNSLLPVLGYSGPLIVGLISGSFMVEVLFAVRGLGTAFVESLGHRDYPVVLGLTLFYGSLLILVSMLLDVAMRSADPRLRERP